jgi:hypothetical protein
MEKLKKFLPALDPVLYTSPLLERTKVSHLGGDDSVCLDS